METTKQKKALAPEERNVTKLQAQRLETLTGLPSKNFENITIADLNDKFRFRIDLELLFFRRICGRVVKKDPATGVEYPVPHATVHVYDTDCGLIWYSPSGWPWSWLLPFWCHKEEIATAVTDNCGRFCVLVPRWDIDYILRWRLKRICWPVRPTIRDFIEEILPFPPVIRPPRPEPDPAPFIRDISPLALRRLEEVAGRETVQRLATLELSTEAGGSAELSQRMLDRPVFSQSIPPPLPPKARQAYERRDMREMAGQFGLRIESSRIPEGAVRVEPDQLRFIGPFIRCKNVLVPEWSTVIDVPDITFGVTQDVDGDGDEEVIYGESLFDVRWNAGSIPFVTLEASPIAVAGVACNTPPVTPCSGTPDIQFVGLMPLVNPAAPADPYHDAGTGYGRRPNKPHPSGNIAPTVGDFPLPLAEAPYTQVLQLYGCNEIGGAQYYRLRYRYNNGSPVSFTGLTWPLHRVVGGNLQTHWPSPDADGWYPILPSADNWFPQNLLLNWPTSGFANGLYTVHMELGNAGKSVINSSAAINFRIDNNAPTAIFTKFRWRVSGGGWIDLPLTCPVITRPPVGGSPADIEFELSYQVSAVHLRDLSLSGHGCGSVHPQLVLPLSTAQHWHTDPNDNSYVNTAVFTLPGTAPQGGYSFHLFAASRAFNPAGGDGGFEADWQYNPVYNYVQPFLPVAVVNA